MSIILNIIPLIGTDFYKLSVEEEDWQGDHTGNYDYFYYCEDSHKIQYYADIFKHYPERTEWKQSEPNLIETYFESQKKGNSVFHIQEIKFLELPLELQRLFYI